MKLERLLSLKDTHLKGVWVPSMCLSVFSNKGDKYLRKKNSFLDFLLASIEDKKWSIHKGKNLLLEEQISRSKFFPFRTDPFCEGRQTGKQN